MEPPAQEQKVSSGAAPAPLFGGDCRFLLDVNWWRRSLAESRGAAREFLMPAIVLTSGNLALVGALYIVRDRLSQPDLVIENILILGVIGMIVVLIAMVLVCWALVLWMTRMSIYAHALAAGEGGAGAVAAFAPVVKAKSGYLCKLWLVASCYLLVLVVPMCAGVFVRQLSSMDQRLLPAGFPGVPEWLNQTAVAVCVLTTVPSLAYSLCVFVASAVSKDGPAATATRLVWECCRHLPAMIAVTLVVLSVNAVVNFPEFLSMLLPKDPILSSLGFMAFAQIWLGVTGLVLWPWSLAPFHELLLKEVRGDG